MDNSSNFEVSKASVVDITWRFQKNNDNEQVVSYVKDSIDKPFCIVEHAREFGKGHYH